MTDGANICARNGCDKLFNRKTHNQKYCSDECCRLATNAKIMERYYENKRLRSGAHRECTTCSAKLSKYNLSSECASCIATRELQQKNLVKQQIAVIVWE